MSRIVVATAFGGPEALRVEQADVTPPRPGRGNHRGSRGGRKPGRREVGSIAAQIAVRDGARVIGTASGKQFGRLRSYGVIPVTYGKGLLDRVRSAAPDGVGAAIDTVGTDEAIDVSLDVLPDRRRIATIAAFDRAQGTGIKELGGSPGSDQGGIEIRNSARLRLTSLVTDGLVQIVLGPGFPLADVAEAHRQLASGKTRGRIILIPCQHHPLHRAGQRQAPCDLLSSRSQVRVLPGALAAVALGNQSDVQDVHARQAT
ncbi:MAG TPA: zinc-binding dehydrogenase, partial [Trebonia sp.]|nr:zinc-binding dehydrogenase [Trebonia sp.]